MRDLQEYDTDNRHFYDFIGAGQGMIEYAPHYIGHHENHDGENPKSGQLAHTGAQA
jgi:hypothetical protein